MQLFDVPARWRSLGTERLHKIELPPEVKRVVIFADNGEPGRKAAMRAVDTYTGQHRKATRRAFRLERFGDFNDLLQALRSVAA